MTDISKEVRERLERRAQELEDDLKCTLGDAFCRRFAADIHSILNHAAQQAARIEALLKLLEDAYGVQGLIMELEDALEEDKKPLEREIKRINKAVSAALKSSKRALLTEGTDAPSRQH